MVTVSVTRFRLNSGSPRGQIPFFYHTLSSVWQSARASGFLRGKLVADTDRTYWTITIWQDLEASRTFMKTGAHKRAMRAMPFFMDWCDEASTCHFEYDGDDVPGLVDVHQQMQLRGHFLRLHHPSVEHQAKHVPCLLWSFGRVLHVAHGGHYAIDQHSLDF
jgi:heme-degrading monooxygenase HmoA